ncbi:NAD(P)H-quinone oxidoreductase [Alkalimarinus sediminis]|uniref:NAD(P)H-quinone oxidoreductase n=1 Tax=Alkalimarinus sediminis TaxID=1632866 RepID=A0A9E8KQH4_9ALTE|nr:NAD(P)H-quinone oxidoreductase [Alkalimarinus sediminis]UZW76463.1 NAD(P)H-quinone oxidoreductase [Alkalimarinus sediminis]
MKFIDIKEFGGPEVLTLKTTSSPTPSENEVLINVVAAGVNRPDVIQRQGHYPAPPGASPILGLEVSGEVIQIGKNVTGLAVGDKVCALANGGGYAEQVCVPASQCLPIPRGLTMVEAAALPETFFTVWSNVFDRGHLQPGESLLIHGGSSGIGTTAIQMGKAMGAKVFITAGSQEKCDACIALGADVAINYHESDFVEVIKEATGAKGVDVILDMVGGDYIPKNFKIAALEGRIINIAFLQGPVIKANFLPVMLKRLTVTGSTLRPQTEATKAAIATHLRNTIWPKIETGEIKPVIAKVFPLEEAENAHRLMESNQHIGKIVLKVAAE